MWKSLNTLASQVAETVAPALNEARDALANDGGDEQDEEPGWTLGKALNVVAATPLAGGAGEGGVPSTTTGGWSLKTALNAVAPVMDELRDALRRTPEDEMDDDEEEVVPPHEAASDEVKKDGDGSPISFPQTTHTPIPEADDANDDAVLKSETASSSPIPVVVVPSRKMTDSDADMHTPVPQDDEDEDVVQPALQEHVSPPSGGNGELKSSNALLLLPGENPLPSAFQAVDASPGKFLKTVSSPVYTASDADLHPPTAESFDVASAGGGAKSHKWFTPVRQSSEDVSLTLGGTLHNTATTNDSSALLPPLEHPHNTAFLPEAPPPPPSQQHHQRWGNEDESLETISLTTPSSPPNQNPPPQAPSYSPPTTSALREKPAPKAKRSTGESSRSPAASSEPPPPPPVVPAQSVQDQSQLLFLQQRVQTLEGRLQVETDSANEWRAKYDSVHNRLENSIAQNAAAIEMANMNATRHVNELTHQLNLSKQELEALVSEKRVLNDSLVQERANAEDASQRAEELLKQRDAFIASLQAEVDSASAKAQAAFAAAAATPQPQAAAPDMSNKIKAAKNQIAKLKKELEESSALATERLHRIQSLESQHKVVEEASSSSSLKNSDAEVAAAQALWDEAREKLLAVQASLQRELDDAHQALQQQQLAATRSQADMSKQHEEAMAAKDAEIAQLSTTVQQLKHAQSQLQSHNDDALRNHITQAESRVAGLAHERDDARQQVARLQDEVANARTEIERTQGELQKATSAAQVRIGELEHECTTLRSTMATMEAASHNADAPAKLRVAELEQECESLRNTLATMEAKVSLAIVDSTRLAAAHEEEVQALKEKAKQNEVQYQKTHASMEAYLNDMRAELASLEEKRAQDGQTFEKLHGEMAQHVAELRGAEVKCKTLQEEIDTLRKNQGTESTTIKNLEEQVMMARERADKLESDLNNVESAHEQVMSVLRKDIDALKAELGVKNATLDTLTVESEKISLALSRTTSELERSETQHRARIASLRQEHDKEMKMMVESLQGLSKKEEEARLEAKRLVDELEKLRETQLSVGTNNNGMSPRASPDLSLPVAPGGATNLIEKNVVSDLCVAFVKRGNARGDMGRKEVIETMARHLGWSAEVRRQVDETYQSTASAAGLKNLVSSVVPASPSIKLKPLIASFGGEVANASKMLEEKSFADAVQAFLEDELGGSAQPASTTTRQGVVGGPPAAKAISSGVVPQTTTTTSEAPPLSAALIKSDSGHQLQTAGNDQVPPTEVVPSPSVGDAVANTIPTTLLPREDDGVPTPTTTTLDSSATVM